ncbi:hypothetical protein GALMADRAFT_255846, partial [Galerina marginata CBS 339.88]
MSFPPALLGWDQRFWCGVLAGVVLFGLLHAELDRRKESWSWYGWVLGLGCGEFNQDSGLGGAWQPLQV